MLLRLMWVTASVTWRTKKSLSSPQGTRPAPRIMGARVARHGEITSFPIPAQIGDFERSMNRFSSSSNSRLAFLASGSLPRVSSASRFHTKSPQYHRTVRARCEKRSGAPTKGPGRDGIAHSVQCAARFDGCGQAVHGSRTSIAEIHHGLARVVFPGKRRS
jgi:hypothetical protein